jgi:hypothetical protein
VSEADLRQTVDAVWRMEAAKIVATLTRAVGHVGRAPACRATPVRG